MSHGAAIEAFQICKNTKTVVKLGIFCAHAEGARIGDMVIMVAEANDRCLIDADEMIDDPSESTGGF